jgi:hypothetical protein
MRTWQTVTEDALNRLVASAADDQSIIGICGETKLENPEGSWWTMIQVGLFGGSHPEPHADLFLRRSTSTTSRTTCPRRSRVCLAR